MGGWEAIGGGGKVEDALADLTGGVAGRFYTKERSFFMLFEAAQLLLSSF